MHRAKASQKEYFGLEAKATFAAIYCSPQLRRSQAALEGG